MTEGEKKRIANEQVAFEYTLELLPPEWTAEHTRTAYDRWDVTASNGKETIYIETKARQITSESIQDEGCLIDESKVDYLASMSGKSAIIQFFPLSNKTYVWNVSERDYWPKKRLKARKNNVSYEKIWKTVYMMPMDPLHERDLDLTDFDSRYQRIFGSLK